MKRKSDFESEQNCKKQRTVNVELPLEIWTSTLYWLDLEIRAEALVASVSKEFYAIILRFVEEEATEFWPKFILKLKSIEEDYYKLVGTLRRMLEVYYNDYLLVNYATRCWICPLCNKQISTGMKSRPEPYKDHTSVHVFTKYLCTCSNCSLKYGETVEWYDNGHNNRTEVCPTCKSLTKRPESHCQPVQKPVKHMPLPHFRKLHGEFAEEFY